VRRVLGVGDLLLIAAAAIAPAFSLATTFGPMVEAGGSATPLALVLVTVIMAAVAVGYRRLGMRSPNAGSSYTWVREAFGPGLGAYAAWILIVANVFATIATAVPAGAYTLALVAPALASSPLADALVGTGWVLATGWLLFSGLRPTSRVANVLVLVELAILAATAVAAFVHPVVASAAASAPPPAVGGWIGAVVIGIWMTDGWEVSASTAEEAQTSNAGPGCGGLAGLAISAAVLWICMTAFLRVGTLGGFTDNEGDAMSFVAGGLGGPAWRVVVTVTVLVSLAASLQTTLVYLTRSFYAMGRDGVLPFALGHLDHRAQPAAAIALLTGLGAAGTLASGFSPSLRAAFGFILSGTSVFLGVLFLLSALAAVRLFVRDRSARWDGVVLPGLAAVALAVLLGVSVWRDDPPTRLLLLGAAAAGIPLAVWRGRARAEFV
jgi:amino acid transporter